jgi:hypothetical protein
MIETGSAEVVEVGRMAAPWSVHLTANWSGELRHNSFEMTSLLWCLEVSLHGPSEHEPTHSMLDSALAGRASLARFSGFEGYRRYGPNYGPLD